MKNKQVCQTVVIIEVNIDKNVRITGQFRHELNQPREDRGEKERESEKEKEEKSEKQKGKQ